MVRKCISPVILPDAAHAVPYRGARRAFQLQEAAAIPYHSPTPVSDEPNLAANSRTEKRPWLSIASSS
jgi:hypothetical protein